MENFKSLVKAVEENNSMNNAKWSDWETPAHIQEVYGSLQKDYSDVAEAFLAALIRDNGNNIQNYLDSMSCLEFGQAFSGEK